MSSISFRSLGNSGISLSAPELGCMGMSFLYGPTDDAENMRGLHRYLDLGGNFLDTAEVSGPDTNEELLSR
jgi:aryl-alcohol dehydrogenase-like predicted oxidoreductase